MVGFIQKYPQILLVLLGVLIYSNSLQNGYTLDDSLVITDNRFVQDGISGISEIFTNDAFTGFFGIDKKLVEGGRYRPLSLAMFAVEYQLFGNNPFIGHMVNLALYLGIVLIIFSFTQQLFKQFSPTNHAPQIALITSLLFLAHPVHTEVVANIKGRDELLALFFGLLFLKSLLGNLQKAQQILISGLFLMAALLSKENAIVYPFLGIALCMIPSFTNNDDKKSVPKKNLLKCGIVGLVSLALFLILRHNAIGVSPNNPIDELLNNPFINATSAQKFATIFYVLLRYIQLLVFPIILTHDYYPYHISLVTFKNVWVIISIIVHLLILVWILLRYKKQPLLVWLFLFYGLQIMLISNVFFSIGTFMNERFVFAPSFAFCALVAGTILPMVSKKPKASQISAFVLLGIVVFLFAIKTYHRNKVWSDNFTLFTTDVQTSQNSAKANCSAGAELVQRASRTIDHELKNKYLDDGIHYLKQALEIHPKYTVAWLNLGNAYYYKQAPMDSILIAYRKVFAFSPQNTDGHLNLLFITKNQTAPTDKLKGYQLILAQFPNDSEANYLMGRLLAQQLNQTTEAIKYLEKARVSQPDNQNILMDLGITYALINDFAKAENCFQKLLGINPQNPQYYINLGVLYQQNGFTEKAKELFSKAEALKGGN